MPNVHPSWLIVFAVLLALVPILLALTTSYLKLSIVFAFLRSGLGSQQVPGPMLVMALALGMTIFIMQPIFKNCHEIYQNLDPISFEDKITLVELSQYVEVIKPWKNFIFKQLGEKELKFFLDLKNIKPQNLSANETDLIILISAFVLTELKEAFIIGFVILLPFLLIDLIVANLLVGLGMYMVSPIMIALPLKVLIFVFSDAWLYLIKGLVNSYV